MFFHIDVEILLKRGDVKLRSLKIQFEKFSLLDFITYKLNIKRKIMKNENSTLKIQTKNENISIENEKLMEIIELSKNTEFFEFLKYSNSFYNRILSEFESSEYKIQIQLCNGKIGVKFHEKFDENKRKNICMKISLKFNEIQNRICKKIVEMETEIYEKLKFQITFDEKVLIKINNKSSTVELIGEKNDIVEIRKKIDEIIKNDKKMINLYINVRDEVCKQFLIDDLILEQIQSKYQQTQIISTFKPSEIGIICQFNKQREIEFEIMNYLVNLHFSTIHIPTSLIDLWSNEKIIKDELTKRLLSKIHSKKFYLSVSEGYLLNIATKSEETLKTIENFVQNLVTSLTIPLPENLDRNSLKWIEFKKEMTNLFNPLKVFESKIKIEFVILKNYIDSFLNHLVFNFKILEYELDEYKIRKSLQENNYEFDGDIFDLSNKSLIHTFFQDEHLFKDDIDEKENPTRNENETEPEIKTITKAFCYKEHTYPLLIKNMETDFLKANTEREFQVQITDFNPKNLSIPGANNQYCNVKLKNGFSCRENAIIIIIIQSFTANTSWNLSEFLGRNVDSHINNLSSGKLYAKYLDQTKKRTVYLLHHRDLSFTKLTVQLKTFFSYKDYSTVVVIPNFDSESYVIGGFAEIISALMHTIKTIDKNQLPNEIEIQIKNVNEEKLILASMPTLHDLVYQFNSFTEINHSIPPKNSMFTIRKGLIVDQKTDVIVNVSNKFSLTLTDVSKRIIKKTKGISTLLNQHQDTSDKKNGILITKGFGMNCKFIFHSTLKQYTKKSDEKVIEIS